MFSKNEGRIDRATRVCLGIVMIGVGSILAGTWGIILAVVGLIPLITGLVGWCPIYAMFKFDTCEWHGKSHYTT